MSGVELAVLGLVAGEAIVIVGLALRNIGLSSDNAELTIDRDDADRKRAEIETQLRVTVSEFAAYKQAKQAQIANLTRKLERERNDNLRAATETDLADMLDEELK